MQYFSMAGAMVVGLTLVIAGLTKLGDLTAVVQMVSDLDLVPKSFAAPIAYLLPPLELAVGGLMLWGGLPRLTAWAALCLSIAFVIGSMYAQRTNPDLVCHCFGPWGAGRMGRGTLLHAALLGGLSVLAINVVPQSPWVALSAAGSDWPLIILPAASLFMLGFTFRIGAAN